MYKYKGNMWNLFLVIDLQSQVLIIQLFDISCLQFLARLVFLFKICRIGIPWLQDVYVFYEMRDSNVGLHSLCKEAGIRWRFAYIAVMKKSLSRRRKLPHQSKKLPSNPCLLRSLDWMDFLSGWLEESVAIDSV